MHTAGQEWRIMSGTPLEHGSANRRRGAADSEDWPAPSLRAHVAHQRASELRKRRLELACGQPVTDTEVDLARARAQQAVDRAELAERAALYRHLGAWRAHLRAAAICEQAALGVSDVECEALQSKAERHRTAAAVHQGEVARLTRTPWSESSSDHFFHQ